MATPNAPTALPWDAARTAGNMDFSGTPAGLASSYKGNYDAALAFNQANYQNVIGGYQGLAANQQQQQQGIAGGYAGAAADLDARTHGVSQGYGALQGNVNQTIAGIGQSQSQSIEDAYRAQAGQATQSLVGRGLGNTTVLDSVQRGLGLDRAKAQNNLANQLAGLSAGYQSQIGLTSLGQQQQSAQALAAQRGAGLAYGERALGDQTSLGLSQLGFQNSVNAAYPNPQLYGQLAQQYGATQQANADRAQAQGLYDRLLQQSGRAPAVPRSGGGGYQPSGTNFSPPTPNFPGAGGAGAPGGGGQLAPSMYGVAPGRLPAAPTQYSPGGADWLWGAIGGGATPEYGDASYGAANVNDLQATVGPGVMAGGGGGPGYSAGGTSWLYGALGGALGSGQPGLGGGAYDVYGFPEGS